MMFGVTPPCGLRHLESGDLAAGFLAGFLAGFPLDTVIAIRLRVTDTSGVPGEDTAELKIFDNYVVLHYDPQGKASEMSAEEKAQELVRRRDPILFGVFRGSRKLYFVGDWKDEQCDLTLQEIVDKLGEPLEMK